MPDILITGGMVYDGSGSEPVGADVLISGERIADVIAASNESKPVDAILIDAAGMIVTPGFVDVHSHSDYNMFLAPDCDSKLTQGITTEIVGNCGMSAFPRHGRMDEEHSAAYGRAGLEVDWVTADEYFSKIDSFRPALNFASFVGHGNVRGAVMGFEDRVPASDEIRSMEREVEDAVAAGALGFSTGLIYSPGMFADTEEVISLQRSAARKGGIYASHVRGEGDRLLSAAEEFVRVVREIDCQGQYSHLKASGRRNWGKVPQIIEQIESINAEGGFVRFDKYPYVASGTDLASLLPRWVQAGGREAAVKRLRDAQQRAKMQQELIEDYGEDMPWNQILIVDSGCDEFRSHNGQMLAGIATSLAMEPMDLFVELLIASNLSTTICNFTMNQEETDLAIMHPHGMVCSDGEIRTTVGPLAHGSPHPRAFGSFPKFFRDYVLDTKRLSMSDAVRKVTSLPCETFGFKQRGRIQSGYFADILVIDTERLRDRATFDKPLQYSEGIDTVVVNGVVTCNQGRATGNRGGRALRREKQ